MNIISAIRTFFNKFWYQNDPLDEPVVLYSVGDKRINNENINGDTFIKRRKLSPNSEAGIIHIDLTDSPKDTIFLHTMPKPKRNKKDKRTGLKKNDHIETIKVIDDDDSESKDDINSASIDVEIIEDISTTNNLKKNVISPSSEDNEIARDYPTRSTRESSKVKSYLTLSSIRPSSSRIQRNRVESRTLKELNHRSVISNGYPSETYKKSLALACAPATRALTRSFSDNLMIQKMKKAQDRNMFLNVLKNYAHSPDAKRMSPLSSARPSSSVFDSASTDRSSGTFHSQKSNLSSNSKQSNLPLEFPSGRRYATRLQNSLPNNRSLLVPTRQSLTSTSSKSANTPAINKTIIDLTSEEDDECERQEIISNIKSSNFIRNLKTSFVGSNKNIVESDYIYNILKKYEARIRSNEIKAEKYKEQIRTRSSDVNKTISEIFEKRLILKEHEVEEEEQKPSFELAPITKAMRDAINQIVASNKDPLVLIKDTAVRLRDIQTLEHCTWLNDEVINAYMNLIKLRAEKKPDKYPKVHCFNTFLYEQLQNRGYNSVRRWTKKVDIFDFAVLIIPIHLGNHWCLIQINFKEKCIRYFDSMGSRNTHCLKSVMQYLVDEYKDKKNGDLDARNWQLINMPSNETPQQRNMYDCGVFACTFAEHVTRQAPLNFSQDNMPYFRLKMMYEILTGELLL